MSLKMPISKMPISRMSLVTKPKNNTSRKRGAATQGNLASQLQVESLQVESSPSLAASLAVSDSGDSTGLAAPSNVKDTKDTVNTESFRDSKRQYISDVGGGEDTGSSNGTALLLVTKLFQEYIKRPNGELEAKLGKLTTLEDGRVTFVSGIDQDDFQRLHQMLLSYNGWAPTSDSDWVPTYDYQMPNNVRCTKSAAGISFMKKTVVRHINLQCPERKYDIRVSLKDEVPTEINAPGLPISVRKKKRKSFHYKMWSFDLTMVWTGTSEAHAVQQPPTFEVEIECTNRYEAATDTKYAAASLLEKMMDFLGRDTPYTLKGI